MLPRGHVARHLDEGHVRMLTSHGWTEDDLLALMGDWGEMDRDDWYLTRFTTDVVFAGASPLQARQWARLMLQYTGSNMTVTSTVRTMIASRTMNPRHAPTAGDLVEEYALAADTDHDLAIAAYAAGLTIEELAAQVGADTPDLDGLWALAALRGIPRPLHVSGP